LIQQLLDENADLLADLQPWEADDFIQDLVLQAGVEASIEDPLEQAVWEAQADANRYGVRGRRWTTWLYDPPLDEPDGAGPLGISPGVLRRRIDSANSAERVGCRATIETPMGEVTRTVWLRNVGRRAGVMIEFVAENAALMLAYRQAAAMMAEYVDPRPS
jgi:hypothetical protein